MFQDLLNQEALNYSFLNNSVKEYLIALLYFVVFILIFRLLQSIFIQRLKVLAEKSKTDIDDMVIKVIESLRPQFYYFVSLYLALNILHTSELFQKVINVILVFWVVYQVVIISQILIDFAVKKSLKNEDEKEAKGAIELIRKISKIVLWTLGLLFILSNLGVDITSLIAGLGIGGVAIALALQNILSDLFSSFAIYFDKPFKVGDFVIIGQDMGIVEKIGIKTTRIRALQGEEIVISNQELTTTRIQNFKKLKERRIVMNIGVTYSTKNEKLKKIPGIIEQVVSRVKKVRFDRSHFRQFDNSSLLFETVFFIESDDYYDFMDANQEINFGIKEEFEKEKIEFAFPTQTVYLEK